MYMHLFVHVYINDDDSLHQHFILFQEYLYVICF